MLLIWKPFVIQIHEIISWIITNFLNQTDYNVETMHYLLFSKEV